VAVLIVAVYVRVYQSLAGQMTWRFSVVSWRKIGVVVIVLLLVLPAVLLVFVNSPRNSTALHYTFSVVNVYPHDANAFTEGLVFDSGFLYESTGLYGDSSLRRVDLETGEVLQDVSLQAQYFGEGIAVVDDRIVQLTWQSHLGFVYDKASFSLLQEFQYPTEGWGLTFDGSRLIMSDGSANLYFLDPATFQRIGQVAVHDTRPVTELNELEYINSTVYANVWGENKIAVINPQNGQVTAWIDLAGVQGSENPGANGVLNGIAYDPNGHRLFVTGKMWSYIVEINLIPSA
jgi:glutamine cyclotransferase